MPPSEISKNEPQDSDDDSATSSDTDDEAGKTSAAAQIPVEQQLKEVLDQIKNHGKQFKDFSDDIKQRLTQVNMALPSPTALHLLADTLANSPKTDRPREKSVKALVDFLVKYERGYLMRVTAEYTGFTPLHAAISQKKRSLVRWMCQACENVDEILRIPSTRNKRNCMHLAIDTKKEKLAGYLIDQATPETLAAKDEQGNTCLHLASAYGAFDHGQLELIRTIIDASDFLVRNRNDGDGDFNNDSRSPYLYHLDTFQEAQRTGTGSKPLAVEKREEFNLDQKQRLGQASKFSPTAKKDIDAKRSPEAMQKANTAVAMSSLVDKELPADEVRHQGSMLLDTMFQANRSPAQSFGKRAMRSHRDDEDKGLPRSSLHMTAISPSMNSGSTKPKEAKVNENTLDGGLSLMIKAGEDISAFLKKHYLRTRGHDAVLKIIHGTNDGQEKAISFDLSGYQTLSQNAIKTHISILNFESVLQYVDIPSITRREETVKSKVQRAPMRSLLPQTGDGRMEVEPVFQQLKEKGVSTILKVTVDDREQPAHNDAAIEQALKDMNVEVWDWMKVDICPALIFQTAPNITEVHLYWSGTNAVLRAWSEKEGLPTLKRLNKVVLHVLQGCLNSRTRIDENVKAFQSRLIQQMSHVTASKIMNQVSDSETHIDEKAKKSSASTRARLKVNAKDMQEALHDELGKEIFKTEIAKIYKGRRSSGPGNKKAAIHQANDEIKKFWSSELTFEIGDDGPIEAVEAGKRRARQKARQVAAALAQPFCELDLTTHHEASRRGYNAYFSSEKGHLEEPQNHLWIQCMTSFKRLLYSAEKGFELSKLTQAIEKLGGPVSVALIDDGIEVLEVKFDESVSLTGRSFHPNPRHSGDYFPWYHSSGGHGTVMASQIHRICPRAHLSILKLDDKVPSQSRKRQITLKSAARAIREAIDRGAHIISMSWTITPPTSDNEGETQDMHELNDAIMQATKANILMFCSASDEGARQADTYPSKVIPGKIFRIGAADATGGLYDRVGDISSVDFILPGHLVAGEELTDTAINKVQVWSGSSIATALAAGLAALILYCAQIRILRAPESEKREATRHFHLLKQHDNMSRAFKNIGAGGTGNKYPAVWEVFGRKVEKWDDASFGGNPIDLLADVAKELCFKL